MAACRPSREALFSRKSLKSTDWIYFTVEEWAWQEKQRRTDEIVCSCPRNALENIIIDQQWRHGRDRNPPKRPPRPGASASLSSGSACSLPFCVDTSFASREFIGPTACPSGSFFTIPGLTSGDSDLTCSDLIASRLTFFSGGPSCLIRMPDSAFSLTFADGFTFMRLFNASACALYKKQL